MSFQLLRSSRIVVLVFLGAAWALPSAAASEAGEVQSRSTGQRSLPNSVILTGGTHADTMMRLHVTRQVPLASVRANPRMTLGEAQLDFTPMLNNPKALFNVATRLHSLPQHVQVQEETSEVSQIDRGLVIHHVLSYRILPGKCADATARAQLAQAGVGCFTRGTPAQRVAEFSTPGKLRYVADPGRRQVAIAAYQRNSALQDADTTARLAQLKQALANPTQRAAIAQQVGQAEATRMSSLSDDQLKEEVINTATQRFEETAFVPNTQGVQYLHATKTLRISPAGGEMAAAQQLMDDPAAARSAAASYPRLLRIVPPTNFHAAGTGSAQVTDLDLGTYIYLTGFTLGHDYEWSMGISTTINWCIVGCSSTYSVSLYAGFNYGFGLRFPIRTQLKYHNVTQPNNSATANLTANFMPINGSVTDFEASGLGQDQLFDGKELVAQVGADAGVNFNLPVIGSSGIGFSVGVDFTDMLPAPYTGGHFLPPAPGTHGIDTPFTFTSIDLLGGLLDFGVLGGRISPAVDINLHSNKLEFTLNDEVLKRKTKFTATGQAANVGVDPTKSNDSHFSFGNPVYNLGFTLTPGIDAAVYVDLAVWSQEWDWPVWFPQLALDLPPNGIDFSCHSGTTCILDFEPEREAKASGALMQKLTSEGCVQQGSILHCTKLQTYNECLAGVKASSLLGIQSCDPGLVMKELDTADRTLTGGGCQRDGPEGHYLCPVKGMLGLCDAILTNGAILSCGALVPTQVDEILKRGGCRETSGGNFNCPASMMGLCDQYLKNGVILSCKQGN
jgi:hypothetical protein